MRIDNRIEPLVRGALDAAVKQDAQRLDTALAAFPDAASRLHGLELGVAICGFIVIDAYDGKPSREETDAESAINLTFVVTACILAASEKVGEDEWWFNYLDRVESAIEATPAP